MSSTEAPRRAVRLTLKLEADDRGSLAHALFELSNRADRGELTNGVSGGSDSGYIYEYSESDTPTHNEYFEQLRKYLEALKATDAASDSEGGETV